MSNTNASAVIKLAYGMAASQNIAFDVDSKYENNPYAGYLDFKSAAQANRDSDDMPELMSAWEANAHNTIGEILDQLETDAVVLMAAFNNFSECIKAGLVQAATDDNLPLDMNNVDISQLADRGSEAIENEQYAEDVKRLKAIQRESGLTLEQEDQLKQTMEILFDRETTIPFS